MQKALANYFLKEKLFSLNNTILLAVSGGIDSVVLCDLLYKHKIRFAIAHCNFKLRNKESDEDAVFAEQLAEKYNVPFHSISFPTKQISRKNKESMQVTARNLRYEWFEKIRKEFKYDFIATAHHQNDSIETFFINLLRGSGIKGLKGISGKNGKIIRPLLFATKEQIIDYAKKNKLKHREDSSNLSDKYLRNKIRLKLIPLLKKTSPSFQEIIIRDLNYLTEVEKIYNIAVDSQRKKIIAKKENDYFISIKKLRKLESPKTYLYEFLKPFGFNSSTSNKIFLHLNGESGKLFFSANYELLIDREYLIIKESNKKIKEKTKPITFKSKQLRLKDLILKFDVSTYKPNFPKTKNIAAIDFDKLKFPLSVRKWQEGDFFHPIGMKGNKKKLSDFFIDNKFSVFDKENCWILTSNNQIVWIVGHRLDERYKVTEKTRKIYFAEIQ